MHQSIRGRAKRVLVVGTMSYSPQISPNATLAPDDMLIVMEEDAARAEEMRSRMRGDGAARRTVIVGDPKRMLHKLAGPFNVIFCSPAHVSLRPMLEKLLAADGVLIAHGEP